MSVLLQTLLMLRLPLDRPARPSPRRDPLFVQVGVCLLPKVLDAHQSFSAQPPGLLGQPQAEGALPLATVMVKVRSGHGAKEPLSQGLRLRAPPLTVKLLPGEGGAKTTRGQTWVRVNGGGCRLGEVTGS